MALPTGARKVVFNDAPATLVGAANAIAAAVGTFNNAADIATVVNATQVDGADDSRIEMRATFSGGGTMEAMPAISIWARLDSRDGTSQESAPDANNRRHLIAVLLVDPDNIATEQVLVADNCPVPGEVDFELWTENNSGVGIAAGWDLDFVSFSFSS